MNRGKGRGLKVKPHVLFFPPDAEHGRGKGFAGGGPIGSSGRGCGLRARGKEGVRREDSIPRSGSTRGGPGWPSHGGRRQWAAMELGRRPWAMVADGEREGASGGRRGAVPYLDSGRGVVGRELPRWPAVAMASGGAAG